MHVSLTPELENIVKRKVESGLYNNASEVVREALRFMEINEDMVNQMKLNHLRTVMAEAEAQFESGDFIELEDDSAIDAFFKSLSQRD